MDWAMFRDVPFLLMSAGKHILLIRQSNHGHGLPGLRFPSYTDINLAGFFLTFWGIYFSFYFIVTYAQTQLHLNGHASVNLLIVMNATNLPGRLIPPFFSDRFLGPVNSIIPCVFLTAAFLFIWIAAKTHTAILVVASFYGFFAGGVQALYNPAIWQFTGDEEPKMRVRVAFVFFLISLGAVTGTPIGGAIIKHEGGGYLGAQLFAALTVLSGGCLLIAARYAKVGWLVVKV